jgi:NHL repeat
MSFPSASCSSYISSNSRLRWSKHLLALALPFLSALVGFAPSAEAQTAHFSWAMSTLSSGFSNPSGLAVDRSGNVFVADTHDNAVKEILAASGYATVNTLGSGFSNPFGVAVDAGGNVFVADSGNNAVKKILAGDGTIITVGNGFSNPSGVAVDASGNLFVADSGNNAVKKILAVDGTVTTLGNGFSNPSGVAVDASGNVFVADSFNHAVLKLDFADPPSLSFASTAFGSTSSDSPQTVTLTNSGNAPLTFPVPATGLNPSIAAAFTIGSSSTCPQLSSSSSPAALAPGSSCTNLISFTPTTIGSISGSLVTTDDNLNASAPGYTTQSIALSGTATAATPAISFTVPNHTYGDADFTVSATSNSTGAFTYTVVSGPATIAGSTVTLTGAGTVVLEASQGADTNYLAATQNATFTVATITPTILFIVPNHTFGDAPFTVSATSKSTGAYTYSVVSGPATIAGSTVTLIGAGVVVLQASRQPTPTMLPPPKTQPSRSQPSPRPSASPYPTTLLVTLPSPSAPPPTPPEPSLIPCSRARQPSRVRQSR